MWKWNRLTYKESHGLWKTLDYFFDFMSMLGELEDEFDVEIEQQEAAGIRTVGEAVDYLTKLAEKQ